MPAVTPPILVTSFSSSSNIVNKENPPCTDDNYPLTVIRRLLVRYGDGGHVVYRGGRVGSGEIMARAGLL